MSVELVLVGHVGFAEDHTPFGSEISLGGSGYVCARGATVANPNQVGLVAAVGEDFDLSALGRLGIDLQGISTMRGQSAKFSITQNPDGSRVWTGELGVATVSNTATLPRTYFRADHFHLGTMPLKQQVEWLRKIRTVSSNASVSVDMFETTASANPELARSLCSLADLIFLNTVELGLLFDTYSLPTCPMIVKEGANGAYYFSDGRRSRQIEAPQVDAIDTTGAGELVAGVFLSLREASMPILDALHHSIMVASAKVTEFGVDGHNVDTALQEVREAVGKFRHLAPPPQDQ
ncbi:MAG TPA: carbohydrate kinase family protein [Candidatus Saccharimonadales bacterium]|nr:carbohydrate kinase family protein [Candidatus Saccharimonadales bacterium]